MKIYGQIVSVNLKGDKDGRSKTKVIFETSDYISLDEFRNLLCQTVEVEVNEVQGRLPVRETA